MFLRANIFCFYTKNLFFYSFILLIKYLFYIFAKNKASQRWWDINERQFN